MKPGYRSLSVLGVLIGTWGLLSACALPASEPPPVRQLLASAHCQGPPAQAGAAVLGQTDDDGRRVRLSMGERSTGGHAVTLIGERPVAVDDGTVSVRIDWQVPGSEEPVTQTLTRPCLEVAVPAVYTGVRFVDREDVVRGHVQWDE